MARGRGEEGKKSYCGQSCDILFHCGQQQKDISHTLGHRSVPDHQHSQMFPAMQAHWASSPCTAKGAAAGPQPWPESLAPSPHCLAVSHCSCSNTEVHRFHFTSFFHHPTAGSPYAHKHGAYAFCGTHLSTHTGSLGLRSKESRWQGSPLSVTIGLALCSA